MRTWIVLFGLMVAAALAEESAPAKTIGVVAVGNVDSALVERVRGFAQANLVTQVETLPVQPLVGGDLSSEGNAVSKLLNERVIAIVALVWPEEDIKTQCVRLQDQKVTVVNVRAMKSEGIDDENLGRRVERQVMKGIGFMAGMETCPNPFCALTSYGSLEELDQTGRNLCPPCNMNFQQNAKSLGLELDTNNPNYMAP